MKLDKNYNVSFYNSVIDNIGKEKSLESILCDIKNGKYQKQIHEIRKTTDKKKRNQLKKQLPAFTVSGVFSTRKKDALISYNGLIQIDFDNVENCLSVIEKLKNDPYTFVAFLSPSGNGIKLIVKIEESKETHLENYIGLEKYYLVKYKLRTDQSAKDVTRLFFVSFDENIFVNKESKRFITRNPKETFDYHDVVKTKKPVVFNMETIGNPFRKQETRVIKHSIKQETDIEIVIKRIEQSSTDITSNYEDWRNIGFTLSNEYGEQGRDFFHRVSRFNTQYNCEECNKQYDACLKSKGFGISPATFFQLAKNHGININTKKPDQMNTNTEKNSKEGNSIFHQMEAYLSRKYEFQLNTISLEIQFRFLGGKKWDAVNESNLYIELNKIGINAPEKKITALLRSDFVPKYNPLQEYFINLPEWNSTKTDYIKKLCSYVDAKDNQQFEYHFKKWMVRAVKCALEDCYYNKQAFILVHRQQNSGKSTFCRFLCPKKLSHLMRDELPDNKDAKIALGTNFLINLDELAGLSRKDSNQLKTFFSLEKIKERLPYDRKDSVIPRIASFLGSTNDIDFLFDSTGSVRWLCFEINGIDWKYSKEVNIDDVWSQAYALANDKNFDPELSKEDIKLNEIRNELFSKSSIELELITKYVKLDNNLDKDTGDFYTATEVADYIQNQTSMNRLSNILIGKAMSKLGFHKQMDGKRKVYGYYIKTKVS